MEINECMTMYIRSSIMYEYEQRIEFFNSDQNSRFTQTELIIIAVHFMHAVVTPKHELPGWLSN